MSTMKWKDVPTRTVNVGGVPFAYRELGPAFGVPVVFLHHLTAALDDWRGAASKALPRNGECVFIYSDPNGAKLSSSTIGFRASFLQSFAWRVPLT